MKTILISGKQGSGKNQLIYDLCGDNFFEVPFSSIQTREALWKILYENNANSIPVLVIDETFPIDRIRTIQEELYEKEITLVFLTQVPLSEFFNYNFRMKFELK